MSGRLLVTGATEPFYLVLTPQSNPLRDGKSLVITGMAESTKPDASMKSKKAELTVEPSKQGLREWQVAIAGQVPEEEVEDVELEIKRMYLTPILQPYELRCFWWEMSTTESNMEPSIPACPLL